MEDIEKLERWAASGAHWRVLFNSGCEVTVMMITCTGGEVAEWMTSGDPALLGWLGGRTSSDD